MPSFNRYLLCLVCYGILINALSFLEGYYLGTIAYYPYLEYLLAVVLLYLFILDWNSFDFIPVYLKVALIGFIIFESYVANVVLLALVGYQSSRASKIDKD